MVAIKDCESFSILDHWSDMKEISLVVRMRVWFLNVLLASKISMCIDNIYLAFNVWM